MSSFLSTLRVVIVAENASTRFGGEAILPWHYFRLLFRRGVDVHLVTHERTRDELLALLPEAAERIHFVPDMLVQKLLWRAADRLPARVADNTLGLLSHLATSIKQRKMVKDLVRERAVHIVHEPTPVSPKQPSYMFGLGAPVVIGPMNGGMDYPPGFARGKSLLERIVIDGGRRASHLVNLLVPGKRQAAMLLVANRRTRDALPRSASKNVVTLVENGVDLHVFHGTKLNLSGERTGVRFAFMGRLVDWKRVDILIDALARCPETHQLHIIGDGPMRGELEAQVTALGLSQRVTFRGQLTQLECSQALLESDALVLPSVLECGGAVVLEAMAMGLPVIATDWGGPQDYLNEETGILVPPSDREGLTEGLRAALVRLGESPELRARLGARGRERVEQEFDWERKIDRILELYAEVAGVPLPVSKPVPSERPATAVEESLSVLARASRPVAEAEAAPELELA